MSFKAVLRVKPMKMAKAKAQGNHDQRKSTTPNADSSRREMNMHLIGTGDPIEDVSPFLEKYKKVNARGNDYAEVIVTAHQDYFNALAPHWKKGEIEPLKPWIESQLAFMNKRFKGCVASATLHLDEQAPHIHFNIVPVVEHSKNFRHGSSVENKIYYNGVFGDDAQLIAKARNTKNSELTKLGKLQTQYANAMEPLGLSRGIKNSKATHNRVQQFYKHINQTIAPLPPQPDPVPARSFADRAAESAGLLTDRLREIAALELAHRKHEQLIKERSDMLHDKGLNADLLEEKVAVLQKTLESKQEEIEMMKIDKASLQKELSYTKEQVAVLRDSDLKVVAEALCYEGPLTRPDGKPKWKGAIDMLKDVGGLDYKESVNFLASHMGTKVAVQSAIQAAVSDAFVQAKQLQDVLIANPPAKPITKAQYAISKELEKQMVALDATHYRITLQSADDKHPSYNPGKAKNEGEAERFYTKDEVLGMVPKLHNENFRRNYNIYLTPIRESYNYVLLDDVKADVLPAIQASYKPNVILETSPKNYQCIFALPEKDVDKNSTNNWFKQINKQHGDEKISGLRHAIRAAGFTNRKEKHKQLDGMQPFVRLVATASATCQAAMAAIKEIYNYFADAPESPAKQKVEGFYTTVSEIALSDASDDILRLARSHYAFCERQWEPTDWSRADFMFVQKAQQRGYQQDEIAAAIVLCSPHLDSRHSDYNSYIARTIHSSHYSVSMEPKM